jgi:hypothetical protein
MAFFSMATGPGCRQGLGLWLRIMRAKGGTDAGAYVHVVRAQQSGNSRSASCCRSALLNCCSSGPGLVPAAVRVLLGCFRRAIYRICVEPILYPHHTRAASR